MELRVEQLVGNVTMVIPVGRWDVSGAAQIDLRLSAISGSGRPVIINLAEVTHLSSMGIRSIVMSAKATRLKGARLVLVLPAPNVEAVLTAAGIDTLIAVCHDLDAATLAVTTREL